MGPDRLLLVDASPEIFALQHLLQRHPAVQSNDVFKRHRPEPIAIANRFGARRIENLERLLPIAYSIRHHFFVRQLWSRRGAAARVANHPREIANDKNRLMPQILKLSQFSQNDAVAQMNVRGGWINAELYP